MVSAKLKYISNNKNSSLEFLVPENWNELNRRQLLFIADMWESWQMMITANLDMLRVKALLFLVLVPSFKRRKALELLSFINNAKNEDQVHLLNLTDFVFTSLTLTDNKCINIRSGISVFVGPTNKLGNISLSAFNVAITSFNKYSNTKDIKHLDTLIAALYTRKKYYFFGDPIPFDMRKMDENIPAISKIDYSVKIAIWLFFYGCMEYLTKQYPEAFEKQTGAGRARFGFTDLMLSMSGGKFGTFKETGETDLHLILMELVNLAKMKRKK